MGTMYYKGSIALLAILCLVVLLNACGAAGQEQGQETAIQPSPPIVTKAADPLNSSVHGTPYPFPKSLKLQFQPVELTMLKESKVKPTWERTAIVAFGAIDGTPVSLAIYKETDEHALCGSSYERVALLEHRGKAYRYVDCFSSSLETENQEDQKPLFLLGAKQHAPSSNLILHGAAELSANGPGRMAYFILNQKQDRWYGFEDWGFPRAIDLDGDGFEEVASQFEGLHLQWPDVVIYRWKGRTLERSPSIKTALRVPNPTYSEAIIDERNKQITVNAVANAEDFEVSDTGKYQYEDGVLVRVE
ncbi:hypothetical protein [Paenibacillus sp. MMS18-CY102]|uniref:hypothetical protein n=1 Tax=Paenibacillus sp. MMS18-CY102 TaxID=2682849 RepID=UPI001365491C|nr:hypothetical protein [Paenibacillus sp. MMS18-CY102]MWC31305.1 hypothetical protein [Paenibacillus sp. MMS18-CY102]